MIQKETPKKIKYILVYQKEIYCEVAYMFGWIPNPPAQESTIPSYPSKPHDAKIKGEGSGTGESKYSRS